jgi:hypothetical protein
MSSLQNNLSLSLLQNIGQGNPKANKMAQWQVLVSALIGAGTIGVGIWQFSEDSKRRADNAQFESRKPFLVKQMELCFQASEVASTLASSTDLETWRRANETFWMLYWGPLSIVETPLSGGHGPVEEQMVAFGKVLEPLQDNPTLPLKRLEQGSLDLAHKCRGLILDSWKIKRTD